MHSGLQLLISQPHVIRTIQQFSIIFDELNEINSKNQIYVCVQKPLCQQVSLTDCAHIFWSQIKPSKCSHLFEIVVLSTPVGFARRALTFP